MKAAKVFSELLKLLQTFVGYPTSTDSLLLILGSWQPIRIGQSISERMAVLKSIQNVATVPTLVTIHASFLPEGTQHDIAYHV